MKELSIEEKAKAYDEAIEIAKEINNEQRAQPFNVMTRVFPELAESEDERIRKWCISFIKATCDYDSPTSRKEVDDALSWLEKQGEQKPEWSEEDREYIDYINVLVDNAASMCYGKKVKNWLKDRVQPKQEWSDEDSMFLQACIRNIEQQDPLPTSIYSDCIKWLKSLKGKYVPQHTKSELSEEDDGMIKFLLTFFRKEQHATEESHIITWLKALKDRVQPKQEWSGVKRMKNT